MQLASSPGSQGGGGERERPYLIKSECLGTMLICSMTFAFSAGYPQQGRGMGPNFNNPHVMPGGGGGYNVGGGMPGGPYNQGMMPGQGGGGMPPHGGMMRPMMPNPGPMRMAQRPGMFSRYYSHSSILSASPSL